MTEEMDTIEVGARLRGEFAELSEPAPRSTASIVSAGRRRRRTRLLTSAATAVAVVATTAVAVPMVLRTEAGPPTPATAKQELTWTFDRFPNAKTNTGLPDRQLWLGWLTDERQRSAVRAAIRAVLPGARIEAVHVVRPGPYLESGAMATVNVTRRDGRKGSLEVGVYGKLGDPAVHAQRLVETGVRENGSGPNTVAPDVARERRSLGGGLEAVTYPNGAGFWMLPVDLFTADNRRIVVSAAEYRQGQTGSTVQPEVRLTPADALLSTDQLLEVAKIIGRQRPDAVPSGPGKLVERCADTPPDGLPQVTEQTVRAAVETSLRASLPGVKVTRVRGMACWDVPSARILQGTPPGSGQLIQTLAFAGAGRAGELNVTVAFGAGSAVVRAMRVMSTRDRGAAGFTAPVHVDAKYPHRARALRDGVQAVTYPDGAGFWRLPVDVFAPSGANIGIAVSPPPPSAPSGTGDPGPSELTPAQAPLTINQLLAAGHAIAALK